MALARTRAHMQPLVVSRLRTSGKAVGRYGMEDEGVV